MKLTKTSTMEEISDFLLYHMDSADDRKSKVNPSFTKQQMWDVYMDIVFKAKMNNENLVRTKHLLVRNLVKEFGAVYKNYKEECENDYKQPISGSK
jgi:hypothetical protein